jgi:hypothetical protein
MQTTLERDAHVSLVLARSVAGLTVEQFCHLRKLLLDLLDLSFGQVYVTSCVSDMHEIIREHAVDA